MSLGGSPETVGDLCYLAYQQMIGRWRAEPRWTTAHDIKRCVNDGTYHYLLMTFSDRFPDGDYKAAAQLAWEVFFADEVMAYEREKKLDNGAI
jgi:hypothetical protein